MDENRLVLDRTLCVGCGQCAVSCTQSALEVAGKSMALSELQKVCEKDWMFYEESNGGVTLSGGEVMAQDMTYVAALIQRLAKKGYRINIDTCGYAPWQHFEKITPYVDEFLYDLKCADEEKHRHYTGQSNELIWQNLRRLDAAGARIWIRIPVIEGFNADEQSMETLAQRIKESVGVAKKVSLIPYHSMGTAKYQKLERPYTEDEWRRPADEWMAHLLEYFQQQGFEQVQIGG